MRAIVLEKFGGLDSLIYKDIPEPQSKAGHVVIQIKAFGINHAEMHMRRGSRSCLAGWFGRSRSHPRFQPAARRGDVRRLAIPVDEHVPRQPLAHNRIPAVE